MTSTFTFLTLLLFAPADTAFVDEAREHLLRALPGVETIVPVDRAISPAEQEEIERSSGQPWADPVVRVFQAMQGDSLAGLAVIDNARGKDQPITYLLITDRDLAVLALEILAYREAYGGEVRAGAWRRQFEGKKPGDPLRPGKEIKTISGATISSRSITLAVRRQLAALSVIAPGLRRTPKGTAGKD